MADKGFVLGEASAELSETVSGGSDYSAASTQQAALAQSLAPFVGQFAVNHRNRQWQVFRLARARPHDLAGFQALSATKVTLHTFCIWFNLQLDYTSLAFAELIEWESLA